MARLIGVVSKVIGQVYAVGADGGRRLLVDGDRVYAGESLDTGASGAVAVSLQGGGDLTLGRGSSLELTPQLLAGQAPELHIADAAPGTTPLTDVEQLQQAIAAGDDPTLNAEPTAAGPTAPSAPGNANSTGGLGGGHSFVLLTEVGGTVDPVVGFGTEGLNNPQEFPNPDIGTLLSVQAALPPGTPTNPGTPNNPVQINGLDTDGGEQRVFEANLPDGSAPDAAALTRTGSFSVTAADGLATLTIDGVSVIANGALAGDRVTITGQLGNTLVITGYDPTTQTLTYEYTLNDREQHPAGSPPGDDLSEDFYVVATDTDGDSDDAWLNVRIQDDSPTARDDSATVSDHSTTASGTVLSNDTLGADYQANPVTAETIKTDYGTLVLNANGTYTYTLDTSSDAYKLIKVGDTVVDKIQYTITDADGDTSQAYLNVTVGNANDGVKILDLGVDGGEQKVYEANLPDGSSPDKAALTQTGSFQVDAKDGLATLTIDGKTVIEGGKLVLTTVVGQLGNVLTITDYDAATQTVSYSYTLNDREQHPAGSPPADELSEDFHVVATDSNGDSDDAWLNVRIEDDSPTARDDSATVSDHSTTASGNVLSNDTLGADFKANPVTAETIKTDYGTLVLNANGTYTYTLDTSSDAYKLIKVGDTVIDKIQYTITDADGDTSQAYLNVTVGNANDGVKILGLGVDGGEQKVYEANLPDGSSPDKAALTKTGTFQIDAKDGLTTLTIDGKTVIEGNTVVLDKIVGQLGNVLTITDYDAATQTVSYSYTLNDREQHPAGSPPADELSEDFHVIATDTDGDKADAWLNVRIEDDSPTARDDSNRHTVDAKHASTSGNVLLNDTLGADYNPQPVTNAGTLKGTYGTLQLNTDGTYTYTLDTTSAGYKALAIGALGHETFDYSIKDLDGDTSSAQLTLNVKGGDHPISLNIECDTLTVQESALPGGSHSNVDGRTVDGTFQVEAGDGVKTLVVGGITVVSNGEPVNFGSEGVSAKTEYGTFTVTGFDKGTGTVTYHYTLETAADHPAAGHDSVYDNIAIVATDSNNDQATGTLHMNIVDDTPSANSGSQEVHTGSTGTNLLLVVDVSNSMNTSARVGDGSQSRLDLTKAAIDKLLAEYANVGDVRVQIVAFSTEASQVGSDWMTVSQAEKYVASLSASGGTNYDYALDKASDVWSAEGKLAGAQNVSYFFSDGNPTLSDSNPLPSDVQNGRTTQPELGDGISESEQLAWEGFLRDHDIKSYAVGLGKNVAATYLEPIAYDGSQNTDLPAKVVTNLADLPAALISTVTGDPVSGTLVGEGGFGADGGHVQSITLDGIRWTFNPESNSVTANGKGDSFTFDPNTSILTIKTAHGGELQVDMATGDYRYAVGSGSTGSFSEKVSFILEDGDHDTVSSAISIKVSPSTAQPGDDFTAQSLQRVLVHGQDRVLERSEFAANSAAMIATLLVAGVVGGAHAALASDTLQVSLHQGETVNLSQLGGQGHAVKLSLVDADGDLHALKNGQFTASEDGLYQLRVEPAGNGHAEQNYTLKVAVDYSHVETSAQPTVQVQAADDSSHHASVAHASAAAASTADAPASSGEHSASYQGSEHGVQADLREASFNTLTNLLGSQHDDWLHAGDNGSTLNGGAGNDTLVAGKGSDVLTGGSGADTFVWEHGASGHDVVTDFKAGVDTLDLSQLLGDVAKNASLDDFFKVSVSGSGSDATTHLAVSTSANGPAAQTIDLQHTNLAEQYHAGTSAGSDGLIVSAHDVINGMLGDHSLKVDAV